MLTDTISDKFSVFTEAPGWRLVSPTAVKLLLTVSRMAETLDAVAEISAQTSVDGTMEELAAAAGMSDRTVARCLPELKALGWISYACRQKVGVQLRILDPPDRLSDEAASFYRTRIEKQRERLDKQTAAVSNEEGR